MNESSTKYLDELILDGRGLVSEEVTNRCKDYCGLFAFVLSVSQMKITDERKIKLINSIIDSFLSFIERRYKANLHIYNKTIADNPKEGKVFEEKVLVPTKIEEDYQLGIKEAKRYLLVEIRDIIKILNLDLEI